MPKIPHNFVATFEKIFGHLVKKSGQKLKTCPFIFLKCGGKVWGKRVFWPFLWGKNGILATFEKQKWADGIPWESKDCTIFEKSCGHFYFKSGQTESLGRVRT